MNLFSRLLCTDREWSSLVMRLALGIMIVPHGAQKLFGWFGGYGFNATMAYFTDTMGIPWILALIVVLTEFFGGLALLAGIGTRLWASLIGGIMLVAMLTSHVQHGFFMNWFANQKGEGFEFHILAMGLALALVLRGGGRLAFDLLILEHIPEKLNV